MRVFRMETASGAGICYSETGICDAYHAASDKAHTCHRCTTFGETKDEASFCVYALGWKFAFPSLEAAKKWFPEETGRAAMAAKGCQLVEYEVADILTDERAHSCIFDIKNATKIATRDLVTMEQ